MLLRTVLWAVAGAVALFAAGFAFLMVLITMEVCGPSSATNSCTNTLGLIPLAAAPIGAILLGWLSRTDERAEPEDRHPRFGRSAAPRRGEGKR